MFPRLSSSVPHQGAAHSSSPQRGMDAALDTAHSLLALSRSRPTPSFGFPEVAMPLKRDVQKAAALHEDGDAYVQFTHRSEETVWIHPDTAEQQPAGTPDAITLAAYRHRQSRQRDRVDPRTGQSVPAGTAGSIARRAYIQRFARQNRSVDAVTGQPVPPDAAGAITHKEFQDNRRLLGTGGSKHGQKLALLRQQEGEDVRLYRGLRTDFVGHYTKSSDNRPVTPDTGRAVVFMRPDDDTIHDLRVKPEAKPEDNLFNHLADGRVAIGAKDFSNKARRYVKVDANTGQPPTAATTEVINRQTYYSRQFLARKRQRMENAGKFA